MDHGRALVRRRVRGASRLSPRLRMLSPRVAQGARKRAAAVHRRDDVRVRRPHADALLPPQRHAFAYPPSVLDHGDLLLPRDDRSGWRAGAVARLLDEPREGGHASRAQRQALRQHGRAALPRREGRYGDWRGRVDRLGDRPAGRRGWREEGADGRARGERALRDQPADERRALRPADVRRERQGQDGRALRVREAGSGSPRRGV